MPTFIKRNHALENSLIDNQSRDDKTGKTEKAFNDYTENVMNHQTIEMQDIAETKTALITQRPFGHSSGSNTSEAGYRTCFSKEHEGISLHENPCWLTRLVIEIDRALKNFYRSEIFCEIDDQIISNTIYILVFCKGDKLKEDQSKRRGSI